MNAESPTPAPGRWKVLLVDDEPAVHEMSRLILAGLSFEGREVELLCANSAAQAREILAQQHDVALALLDVVMETDDAGLALVQHVREQLHDTDMQIVLRTGQPGMAPEQEVVRRYEINGYVLKTEITAQRLHSIVVSALRSYRHTRSLRSGGPPASEHDAARAPMRLALAAELASFDEDAGVLMQAQPEVALGSNEVVGIELVAQWKTVSGLLPANRVHEALPAGPARERTVRWLLGQACHWARSWHARLGVPLSVSVPLVGECLDDAATLAAIGDAVGRAGLAPGQLDLLVDEGVLLAPHGGMPAARQALRRSGVTLTIADFGARTLSLQRLSQLGPDRLKLHRVFVRGVAGDPERMAIARSLIALAQTLNVTSIADGIACDADAQFFKWEGCDLGQGDALAPSCALGDVVERVQAVGRRAEH